MRLEAYSTLWFLALALAMVWTIRRFSLYGVDDGAARRVIGWSFLAMLAGARSFEYIWNFRAYVEQPSLLLDLSHGGLSEVGAVTGAFFAALFLTRRAQNKNLSFGRLCDVVVLPAFLAIALGRWGCFLNGCCVGIPTSSPLGLHFPFDPAGVFRHPTQLYYSGGALLILAVLWTVERFTVRRGRLADGALIAPLGLILYTALRFGVGRLRFNPERYGLGFSSTVLLIALPFELFWFYRSMRTFSRKFKKIEASIEESKENKPPEPLRTL